MSDHREWLLVPCFMDQGTWYEATSDRRTIEGTLDEARERAAGLMEQGWDLIRIDAHGVAEVRGKNVRPEDRA